MSQSILADSGMMRLLTLYPELVSHPNFMVVLPDVTSVELKPISEATVPADTDLSKMIA